MAGHLHRGMVGRQTTKIICLVSKDRLGTLGECFPYGFNARNPLRTDMFEPSSSFETSRTLSLTSNDYAELPFPCSKVSHS